MVTISFLLRFYTWLQHLRRGSSKILHLDDKRKTSTQAQGMPLVPLNWPKRSAAYRNVVNHVFQSNIPLALQTVQQKPYQFLDLCSSFENAKAKFETLSNTAIIFVLCKMSYHWNFTRRFAFLPSAYCKALQTETIWRFSVFGAEDQWSDQNYVGRCKNWQLTFNAALTPIWWYFDPTDSLGDFNFNMLVIRNFISTNSGLRQIVLSYSHSVVKLSISHTLVLLSFSAQLLYIKCHAVTSETKAQPTSWR